MSDNLNPYKSPETVAEAAAAGGNLSLPDEVRIPLLKSAPWKRFLGIVAFISSGFTALLGLFLMVGVSALSSLFGDMGLGSGSSIFLGLVYMALGLLYFFPGLYLFKSGRAMRTFQETNASADLTAAVTQSAKFWKFYGVLAIIVLSLLALALLIAMIAGIAGLSGL